MQKYENRKKEVAALVLGNNSKLSVDCLLVRNSASFKHY